MSIDASILGFYAAIKIAYREGHKPADVFGIVLAHVDAEPPLPERVCQCRVCGRKMRARVSDAIVTCQTCSRS